MKSLLDELPPTVCLAKAFKGVDKTGLSSTFSRETLAAAETILAIDEAQKLKKLFANPALLDELFPDGPTCRFCGEDDRNHSDTRECIAALSLQLMRLRDAFVSLAIRANGWTHGQVAELTAENAELKAKLEAREPPPPPRCPETMSLF